MKIDTDEHQPPSKVFLVHGEEQASLSMAQKIRDRYGWDVQVPKYLDSISLQ